MQKIMFLQAKSKFCVLEHAIEIFLLKIRSVEITFNEKFFHREVLEYTSASIILTDN